MTDPTNPQQQANDTSVRVAIRVRPLLHYETSISCQKCLRYPHPTQLVISNGSNNDNQHSFTFDSVFNENIPQSEIYVQCVEPLVRSYLDGYNTTILAYGQTGNYHINSYIITFHYVIILFCPHIILVTFSLYQ
jgi:kinesin family protein 4/21/27